MFLGPNLNGLELLQTGIGLCAGHELFLISHEIVQEAFHFKIFLWIRAQFQVVVVPPLNMASPFRRKSKERKSKKDDDIDLEEVVEAEEPLEENVAEVLESLDLEQALFESAKRVTHTCMDIREERMF